MKQSKSWYNDFSRLNSSNSPFNKKPKRLYSIGTSPTYLDHEGIPMDSGDSFVDLDREVFNIVNVPRFPNVDDIKDLIYKKYFYVILSKDLSLSDLKNLYEIITKVKSSNIHIDLNDWFITKIDFVKDGCANKTYFRINGYLGLEFAVLTGKLDG